LLEKIDDIPIVHLTEEFSLNKNNQAIVQIFITHFIPLLVLHKIHSKKNTLSTHLKELEKNIFGSLMRSECGSKVILSRV